MKLKNQPYNTFIQMLYSGLKKYSYKDKKSLFRGSIISNDEMKNIEELYNKKVNTNNFQPKVMMYSRIFLSFSLNENVAKKYIKSQEGYSSILFEVLNNEKYNSNAKLSSFSDFPEEEEILFFPFSSFLIKEIINEKKNLKKIILEYLGVYENIINESMESLKNKPDVMNNILKKSNFSKEVFNSKSILNENQMNQNSKKESFSNVNSRSILNENNKNQNNKKERFAILESIFIENIIETNKEEIQKKENDSNSIICEYDIKKDIINKPIQILNSYEEVKRKNTYDFNWAKIKAIENEKEIKENCEIYLNNNKIDFCYEYKFEKEDKNEIQIISKTLLNNTNWMFYDCSSLIYQILILIMLKI